MTPRSIGGAAESATGGGGGDGDAEDYWLSIGSTNLGGSVGRSGSATAGVRGGGRDGLGGSMGYAMDCDGQPKRSVLRLGAAAPAIDDAPAVVGWQRRRQSTSSWIRPGELGENGLSIERRALTSWRLQRSLPDPGVAFWVTTPPV